MLSRTDWSIAFIAFLVYVFVVVSFRVPIGTAAMATALITMTLEAKQLRIPAAARWAIGLWVWALIGWPVSDYRDLVEKGLLDFAKVCAVLLVAINVISTRNRLRVVLLVLLGTFALYPVRGALFSYFIYGGNIMGRAAWNFIYLNPNDLAGFCLLMFSLVAGVLVTERAKWMRLGAAAGMLVLPFVVVLTGSRAGFIALSVFVLVAFGKHVLEIKKLLTLAAVAVVIVFFIPDNLWRRIGTIADVGHASARATAEDESSTAQRLEIWKVAATVTLEHPVVGVGFGAYPAAHSEYAQRPEFDPTARGARDAHSTYLRLAAELGWIGLLIFCAMVFATVHDAERSRRLAKHTQPRLAKQLLYMELGLGAYLVRRDLGFLGHAGVHVSPLGLDQRGREPARGRSHPTATEASVQGSIQGSVAGRRRAPTLTMCGIAGFAGWERTSAVSEAMLTRMCDAIRHRGPDDEGRFTAPGVALGMRRLSIIDVAGGRQPIANEDDSVHVVFNGEIYNHHAIRAKLAAKHVLRTHADTEVLVHLYEEYGDRLMEHLRGMLPSPFGTTGAAGCSLPATASASSHCTTGRQTTEWRSRANSALSSRFRSSRVSWTDSPSRHTWLSATFRTRRRSLPACTSCRPVTTSRGKPVRASRSSVLVTGSARARRPR